MSLSEIKKKLYGKGQKDAKKESNLHEDWIEDDFKQEKSLKREEPIKFQQSSKKRNRRLLRIVCLMILVVVIFIAIFFVIYKYRQSAFSEKRVLLTWEGPTETASGEVVSYKLHWKNENRAELNDAVLKIKFPDNFYWENHEKLTIEENNMASINLGRIEKNSSGEIYFAGKIYSPRGDFVYLNANLGYVPSNFNSRFVSEKKLGIKSLHSPIAFELSAPQGVADGGIIRYEVSYENTEEVTFSDLRIKSEYPQGFSFVESNPRTLEGNNYWRIGDLSPGQKGKIIIEGKINGNREEVKKSSFFIGSYKSGEFTAFNDAEATFKIISSPLTISQKLNDSEVENVSTKERLNFKISFKNTGDIGLRDVIVTEHLEGEALDFSTLDFRNGGDYDSSNHTITWKASDYPILSDLNPGQEGVIEFSVMVKENLTINSKEDKNFVIKSLAKIDSPDIPTPIDMNKIIASNLKTFKVNSPVFLETLAYYNDETIDNYGPTPPKVGEKTAYTIHWKVSSFSNSLENVRVEASLPGGVTFTGVSKPDNEDISYNARTNKFIWNLGLVEAGVGELTSPREVVFQIEFLPSIEQAKEIVTILKESKLIAKDSFTQEEVLIESNEKTTRLEDDSEISQKEQKVAE